MNVNLSNINLISADPETGYQGNCGNTMVAIAYLLTYLVISFLIVINMYIAVILENYSQATEDVTVTLDVHDLAVLSKLVWMETLC